MPAPYSDQHQPAVIVKASALGRHTHHYLTNHLSNSHDGNERILLSGSRGLFASSLSEAIEDIMLMTKGARCRKPLLHTSINPAVDMSEGEWALAWSVYEHEFDLSNHAYVEVTHTKTDGRTHKHRVYSRVRDDQSAIDLGFNYLRHEKVARILEHTLNRPLTLGRFNRAIIKQLEKDGQGAVAAWLRMEEAHVQHRPSAAQLARDSQQQKRTKVSIAQVREDLQSAWAAATCGQDFLRLILERGYILARGDRRDYVFLDRTGSVHSPRRRLNVRAGALRAFLADLVQEHLPSVNQVQLAVKKLHGQEPHVVTVRAEVALPEQQAAIQHFLIASGLVKGV